MAKALHHPTLGIICGGWHLLKQTMAFAVPTHGGYSTMDEALRAVAKLNQGPLAKLGVQIAISAHPTREVQVAADDPYCPDAAQYNLPCAMNLAQWIDGVKAGTHAPIGRLPFPGFGFPWSDDGANINPDEKIRDFHARGLVAACGMSTLVRKAKAGPGKVIFWDGPDGVSWKHLVQGNDVMLGYGLNQQLPEWKAIVAGLVKAINLAKKAGLEVEIKFEGKPGGDPCYMAVCTDTALEIAMIKQINEAVGFDAIDWQGEAAHERGAGIPFADAMKLAIKEGVFKGAIHLNAGGLGQVYFPKLLKAAGGTAMSLFPQYVDNDYLPGEGVEEWVDDQKESIRVGVEWSAKTGLPFLVEFDARFCRYADTMGALETSTEFTVDAAKEAAAEVGKELKLIGDWSAAA